MTRVRVALLGVPMMIASGCSPGNDGVISEPETAIPEVQALSATPDGVWGDGRATLVHPGVGGAGAVATTAGLFILDGSDSGAPPRQVVTFGGPTRATAMSIVDETTVFVAFDSPAVVRYDMTTGAETGRMELPVGQRVQALFPLADGGIVLETAAGPLRWADQADPSATPLVDAPTGRGDSIKGEQYVVPLTGTSEIAVVEASSSDRIAVAVAAEATLIDAQASPSGSIVAVTAALESNPIDREDRIELLDAVTWAPMGSVDSGVALDPAMWTVTDSAVVVGQDSSVSAWDLNGAPLSVTAHSGVTSMVSHVVAVADGVLSIHNDGTVLRWSSESWTSTVLAPGEAAVESVVVADGGQEVTIVDFFGRITTFDLTTGEATINDRFGEGRATGIAVTGSGDQVAVSFDTGRVVVLDSDLFERARFSATSRSKLIDDIRFDPTTDTLATALAERTGDQSFDDTVTVWDGFDGSARFSIGGEPEDVPGCSAFTGRIAFSLDGSSMALASHDFSVSIIDMATGSIAHHLPTESGTVLDLAFTSDGRYLVASTEGAAIRAWDTADFDVAADMSAPMGGYQAIAMLPDGVTMAAVDLTGVVSLVDVLSGEVRATFAEPTDRTSTIVVSDDGALVAAPDLDSTVSVWSTESGRRVASLVGAPGTVIDLRFAPGGGQIVVASDDGTVRRWAIDRLL